MRILSLIALIFFLVSCQVKQGASDGGLISGHVPVQNAFTVSLPANGSYRAGSTLTFTLSHPYILTVTGSPRLALIVGATTVYATYLGGSGTKNLQFSYTVQNGHNDSDGVALASSLDLNGGTIIFDTTSNVSTTLSSVNSSGIRIDTTAPAITGASAPTSAFYYFGTTMIFTVSFAESVTVVGTPFINFTMNECATAGTLTKQANYVSGSGTNSLIFTYAIEQSCNETTGIPVTTTLNLNGGTIRDLAGNDAALDFSAFITSPLANTIQARGRYPVVTSITPPTARTYGPGEALDFILNFDRAVTVTGTTSYINMTIGTDATKQIQYVSGTGTNQLTYRYVVFGGDVDPDGIELGTNVVNETTISSGGFSLVNGQSDLILPANTSGVIIDAPIPSIVSIQLPTPLPPSGYYKLGDQVQVVANFSEPVVVSQGTPTLTSVVGSTVRKFIYLTGSGTSNLIFTYTVQNTDEDLNGVDFTSPLNLEGAIIQNPTGTNADLDFTFTVNPLFRFDGVAPTIINSVVSSAAATNHPDYRLNQYVYIDLTFSEAVTVTGSSLALNVGGTARTATFNQNVSTTVKRYRYRVQTTDHALQVAVGLTVDTTLAGGTIQDMALNDISDRTVPATNTTGVEIDGAVPTLTGFTAVPAAGTYNNGRNLDFTVTFSESVTVTGTPALRILLAAGGPGLANYVSGSGSSTLNFRYTVEADDLDTDGIAIGTTLNYPAGAGIADTSVGNALTNSFTVPNISTVIVDGVIPVISSISGPAANTYVATTNLDFTVTYSENVLITGFPQLELDIGGVTKYATYVSGSGSSQALYRYPVETELTDRNGVQVTNHILNSGTIRDAAANSADLTNSSFTYANALVDSRGPQILSITPPTDGIRVTGNTLSFTVNFDENVFVTVANPTLALNVGGATVNATYASGSGSSNLVFTTSALTNDHFDPDGIAYSAVTLGSEGTMRDVLNHDANRTFTAGSLAGIKVIYSEVISWLEVASTPETDGAPLSSVSDLSTFGNNASANAGTVTKILSDPGLANRSSADFNGTSSLIMPSMSVKTIIVAFRASSAPVNSNLLSNGTTGIILTNSNDLVFSLLLTRADWSINGGALGGNWHTCNNCYDSSTTKVLTVNFAGIQTIAPLVGDNFDGRISEIWILNGSNALTNAQILKISNYLNSKY